MIKADLKTFSKAIDNINSTLQQIDELANTALHQIIGLYELSKKIHVITQDDIVPLSSIFPAEQLIIKAGLTPPEPGAELVHVLPKRTRGKKATEPEEPPATEPEENKQVRDSKGEIEKGPETPTTEPDK